MTGENYLLDTNIIVDLFGNDVEIIKKLNSHEYAIPTIVIGELFYGANLSSKPELRVSQIERFLINKHIYSIDQWTSRFYGEIKAKLRKQGTPIPENDLWIAALTMQHNLILATRDQHFKSVSELRKAYW